MQQSDRPLGRVERQRLPTSGRVQQRHAAPVGGETAAVRGEQHQIRGDRAREQIVGLLGLVAHAQDRRDDERRRAIELASRAGGELLGELPSAARASAVPRPESARDLSDCGSAPSVPARTALPTPPARPGRGRTPCVYAGCGSPARAPCRVSLEGEAMPARKTPPRRRRVAGALRQAFRRAGRRAGRCAPTGPRRGSHPAPGRWAAAPSRPGRTRR